MYLLASYVERASVRKNFVHYLHRWFSHGFFMSRGLSYPMERDINVGGEMHHAPCRPGVGHSTVSKRVVRLQATRFDTYHRRLGGSLVPEEAFCT